MGQEKYLIHSLQPLFHVSSFQKMSLDLLPPKNKRALAHSSTAAFRGKCESKTRSQQAGLQSQTVLVLITVMSQGSLSWMEMISFLLLNALTPIPDVLSLFILC